MNINPQRRKKDNLGITCNVYILYIKIYMLIDIDIVNVQTTKTLALTIWESQ